MSSLSRADAVLAPRYAGSNSVIAFTVANALNSAGVPHFDPTSSASAYLAYAVTETSRAGVAVAAPPGGKQALVVMRRDVGTVFVELQNETMQRLQLTELGIKLPVGVEGAELDRLTVEGLLENGFGVRLERPFEAGVRNAVAEHGIDLRDNAKYSSSPMGWKVAILAERSVEAVEEAQGKQLFSFADVADLDGVAHITKNLLTQVRASEYNLFAVYVPSFVDVECARSTNLSAKGTFASIATLEGRLERAMLEAKTQEQFGNHYARTGVVAAFGRLEIMKLIEAHLVNRFLAHGVEIESSVHEQVHRVIAPSQTLYSESGRAPDQFGIADLTGPQFHVPGIG